MTGKARYDGLEAVVDAVMTLTGCTDRKVAEMLTFPGSGYCAELYKARDIA